MITGAIFDADGVLLDSMTIWNDLGARYLRSLGVEPEPGLNKILFAMSMEQGAEYLQKNYSLSLSQTEILQGIEALIGNFYFDEVSAKDGAKELLDFLAAKGIPLALATSSPREHITRAFRRNGILDYFEGRIFTTSEVGVSKHQPDIYRLAAENLNSPPPQTLVFEDSLYALTTAKQAGFYAVGVFDANGEPDQQGTKATADLYLTNLADFMGRGMV